MLQQHSDRLRERKTTIRKVKKYSRNIKKKKRIGIEKPQSKYAFQNFCATEPGSWAVQYYTVNKILIRVE